MTEATVKRGPGRPRKNPEVPAAPKFARKNPNPKVIEDPELENLNAMFVEEVKVIPLSEQSYDELMYKALNIYKLNVDDSYSKQDLIDVLQGKSRRTAEVVDARVPEVEVKPGYAKIELYKDGTSYNTISAQRAANRPQYVACNGARYMIPKGIPVIVPIKIMEVLKNSKTKTIVTDEENTDSRRHSIPKQKVVETPRFPFIVHEVNPGPDPKPSDYEKAKKVYHSPRQQYHNQFGLWPTTAQLKQAIQDGIIVNKPGG